MMIRFVVGVPTVALVKNFFIPVTQVGIVIFQDIAIDCTATMAKGFMLAMTPSTAACHVMQLTAIDGVDSCDGE